MPTLKASERPPHLSQRSFHESAGGTASTEGMATGGAGACALKTGREGGGLSGTSGGAALATPDKEILSVGLFLTKAGFCVNEGGDAGATGAICPGTEAGSGGGGRTGILRACRPSTGRCIINRLWLTAFVPGSLDAGGSTSSGCGSGCGSCAGGAAGGSTAALSSSTVGRWSNSSGVERMADDTM